jgi:hypothetical protein
MRGNLGNLMKQAQAMQAALERAQAELAALEVEGRAGGGAVVVRMTGKHELRAVSIAPEALADRELLEDLVLSAANDALRQVARETEKRMGALQGGLPPGLKLPF